MKKIYIFAAVLALLTLSLNAQLQAKKKVVTQPTTATEKVDMPIEGIMKASKPAFNTAKRAPSRALETATLDLFDTTTYVAEVLPIYGYWHDATQHNQMIYPASLLTDMAGSKIKSMTFYPASYSSSSGINFRNGSVTFKLMEVNGTTGFAESNPSYITGTMTTVKTVSMPSSANTSATTWLIEFDQEYEYNGGDLVIDVTNTKGNYGHTYFYVGTTTTLNVNYPGLLQYSSYDAESLDFVPQVSFTYEYDAQPKHDLAIALSAPTTAAAGSTVTLTATVTNNGDYDENGYTVTFTANGTTINTQTGGSLAQGASATFTYTYTTTDAQGGTNVNFGASVACTDDAVATNNEATASTSVLACPPPENVAATPDGNSGTMTWTAPIIGLVPATLIWDFEGEADFTAFTTIDSDGDGYNWAWHYNDNTSGSNLEVHSGNGQIYSQSYDKATSTVLYPDNWLISPEVTLGGTLSFWACGQDPNQYWNEVFAVYVCVGSYNGVSDFIKISPDITTTHAMTEYSYDLSQYQGQGYFAIRHYNVHDEFYLVVDDITLETMLPGEQPTSYNIYLDGQLEGNVDANTFSYTFNNLSNGTYNCAVSAVYSYGESVAVPATFTIDTTNPTIEITPATQTINDAAAGTLTITGTDIDGNINVSAGNDWSLNPTSLGNTGGNVSVTYTGRDLSATTTVTASATGATDATATVDYVADLYIVGNFGSGWDFTNGTSMSYNNGTYTATLTVDAGNYILFARLLGNSNPWNTRDVFGPNSSGDWWMDADQKNGTIDLYDDDPIYFTEGGTYRITINSDGTFTITKLSGEQTAQPVITYSLSSDGQHVTITATGDGTVTLNVPGHDPVSGEGEVSITVPCGYASNTITVTATAQEVGKDESDPTYRDITIPAGSDWVEMDGTYDNPNDLLSFLKNNEDIMMVDQFAASTFKNDHPEHYTYTLRQTVNGETQTSTPVSIPVYKTSSTMYSLYTEEEVLADNKYDDNKLKANVLNTEMDFDVNPDRNVLYYSLYRGDLNATYPEITAQSRVSQLQKFEEMVGEGENAQPQYFLFESHPEGIAPRYDRLGTAIAERLDTNWVEAGYDDQLAYVPVIWTYGLYTARGDGKNNSYGSDIKNSYLGKVDISVEGYKNDENNTTGQWDSNGMTYCVYSPIITLNGHTPEFENPNDGDTYQYVPYMYRVWCTYPSAHNFSLVYNDAPNPDGRKHLVDAGPIEAPFLIGEATAEDSVWHNNGEEVVFGRKLASGEEQQPWSFGVPKTEDSQNVKFIARFYYKKIVTPAAQANGLRGNRGSERAFAIAQNSDDGSGIVTGISELSEITYVVSKTYVNAQGMQSDKPFDGLNIVVTRFSDGTTTTTKVVR